MIETVNKETMLIAHDWPVISGNPKYSVLVRRRKNLLKNLHKWNLTIQMLVELIKSNVKGTTRIMEVACGTGFTLLELSNKGFQATGLEIDPNLCELVNLSARQFNLNTRAICGDACSIPVPNNSFDVVISDSFFEHVYDVDLALREQSRILRKGGLLIIQDGNLLNMKLLIDLLIFYPIRTRGKYGGLKWLFTKNKAQKNLYDYLPLGRDEDVKTIWWWRRKINQMKELSLVEAATTVKYTYKFPPIIIPFLGKCLVVAKKAEV